MIFRFIRQMVMVLGLSGLGHWVLGRWALRVFPGLDKHRTAVKRTLFVLACSPYIMRLLTETVKSEMLERIGAAALLEFMFAILAAMPIGALEAWRAFAERRARMRAASAVRELAAREGDAPEAVVAAGDARDGGGAILSRREVIERGAGLAFAGSTAAVLGWGMVRGRHAFVIEEVPVRIPGLPRALDGYTIAQISDVHVGLFVGERELREGLDRVREIRPDMVVATGDLVDYDPRFAGQMARAIADVPARDGVFAILGNHDYYTGHEDVMRALAATRIDLLLNAGRRIRPMDGGGFALLGIDDRWATQHGGTGPDLARAIAMVPPDAPRVLLSHQPVTFDDHAGKVALQLSGHTHGGQINPVVRPASLFMRYVSGRYERNGSTLWVNRGFGVAGPPSRICAPPEVTKIVLVAA